MAKTPHGFSEHDPLAIQKELAVLHKKAAVGFARLAVSYAQEPISIRNTKIALVALFCSCASGAKAVGNNATIALKEFGNSPA